MTKKLAGPTAAAQVLNAMGLPVELCTKLTIEFGADRVVTATASYVVTAEQVDRVTEVVRRRYTDEA